MFVFPYNI